MSPVRDDGANVIVMHGTTPIVTRDDERLAYKPSEVAKRLGISTRHVYRLINADRLQVVTLGGRWMVLASSLDAFLARLEAGEAA